MAESARRRPSKWDLKEEPNSLQKEIRQDSALPVKTSQSFHDEGSNMEMKYSKGSGPNLSDMEPDRGAQPKDNSGGSFLKSSSGSRREQKDGDFNRYSREISESRNKRARDESYSMSPRTDRWRRRSRSRSPKNGWSRSRSRSPSRGFRRESEGRNDRVRGGSGVPASTCRDYVGGRCSRGSQCRFLHQDDHDTAGRKHSGGDSAENWSSRHERGGSSENNLERDYSCSKNSHLDGHPYDGNLEKHETPKNSRSSNLCNHFLKGRCYKGSSCIYSHDSALADAHGTRESSYKSRDENASFGADSRQPRRRISEVPCKFFAVGNCRNGVSCKFLHDNAAHDDRSEEKSRESRWASNLENENRSWGGSKWSNEAADSAGRPQNIHWGRNLDNGRSEENSRDSRWGSNLENEKKSLGGSKWSNEAAASADGRPQNVLWGQNLDNDRSEDKSKDSKWGSNFEIENRSRGGPQWSKGAVDSAEGWPAWGEKAVNTDATQFQEWRNDAAGTKMGDKTENNSWDGSKWADKAAPEVTKSPQWRKNEDGVKTDVLVLQPADRWGHNSDDQNRNLGAPQSDKPDGLASHASSQWVGGNTSGSMGIWASKGAGELLHAGNMPPADPKGNEYPHFPDNGGLHNQHLQSFKQKEHTLSISEQTMSGEVSSQQHHAPPILQPAISESMHIQQQWNLTGTAATFPLENIDGVANGVKQQNEASVSEGKFTTIVPVHEQSYSLKENLVSQPVSSFNVEGQGIRPSPAPSVQTFDLNGPSQEMISHKFSSPHLPTLAHVGETLQRSDMVGQKMSPTNTGHPLAQKIVTSEQAAQITNLSASLAQIFANGQQLPQLYASLNASHSKGLLLPCHPNSAGPVAPVAASFTQSNQDFWHQAQYNPIAERTNSLDISVRPPGFPLANPIELNKTSGQESQITVASIGKSYSGGTVAPVAASFAQSNQDFWHQAQYNPIAERINLSDISVRPPGFPVANPVELNNTSEQESQIAVTSISKFNSAGPVAPVVASFAQSNQDIWHQAQYNPIAERTNSSDISVYPPGFPLANPMELNKPSEQESQILVTSIAPSSIIGEPKKPSADGLVKIFHHRSLESKQSQPVDDGRAYSETIKERENAHLEDMNADGQVDDEGKKNKDPKGMRMFKFAVVEFVKEILKPTWKEGQMSKEAHKTIVKKVVDKVTGSLPVEQIPQTQERIDHYLSCSKSKLTKLVQGYVDKYLKS